MKKAQRLGARLGAAAVTVLCTLGFVSSAWASSSGRISVDASRACALRADGTIACWGSNAWGSAVPPSGSFTQVTAGGDLSNFFSCGLRSSGAIACWGDNAYGQSTPPAGAFSQVSGGATNACGVRTNGSIACWGDNSTGQAAAPGGSFTQVSAGMWRSCGVKTNGALACWGADTGPDALPPPPGGTFTRVAVGAALACGLHTSGTIECWGSDTSASFAGTYVDVSMGFADEVCAVASNGKLVCQGATPPSGSSYVEVSVCGGGVCGVDASGTPACTEFGASVHVPVGTIVSAGWGGNYDCNVRPGGTLDCSAPGLLLPTGVFSQVSVAAAHGCGLRLDRTAACWGSNLFGEATAPNGSFFELGTAYEQSCGRRTDGTLVCWGDAREGQASTPPGAFSQLSVGDYHSCALRADGTVACWGLAASGAASPPAGTFSRISAGTNHTCGVKTDRTLACWGSDTGGAASPPPGAFVDVNAGFGFSCALKTDDSVICWGANTQASPGAFARLVEHAPCALDFSQRLWCWGSARVWQPFDESPPPPSLAPPKGAPLPRFATWLLTAALVGINLINLRFARGRALPASS